jgi:hypothetical protein
MSDVTAPQPPEPGDGLVLKDRQRPPVCSDFDEDCVEVPNKLHCWLYDPAKGRCPYLGRTKP